MRIAWITDPHLNHCSLPAWERFLKQVETCACDALVITGDVSEGEDVVFQLTRLADTVSRPTYFVLGNHDFYHSSIERTRKAVSLAAEKHPWLHYLRDESVIELSPSVALVGEDGWGDATAGNYKKSLVQLNDFRLIDDFYLAHPSYWQSQLNALGKDARDRLRSKLNDACRDYPSVLVATHVPPFREACWYEGRTTDDHWAPFFVCGQLGEMLREAAKQHPDTTIELLCGHTHHGGEARIEPNLNVTTGGADYGHPEVNSLIEVDEQGFDNGKELSEFSIAFLFVRGLSPTNTVLEPNRQNFVQFSSRSRRLWRRKREEKAGITTRFVVRQNGVRQGQALIGRI